MTYWQLLLAVHEAQRLSDKYDELEKQLDFLRASPSSAFLAKQISAVEDLMHVCKLMLSMKVPND